MIKKIRRFFELVQKRQLWSLLYMRICLYKLREIRGHFSLLFHKLLYHNFSVGKNVRCWGKIIVGMSEDSFITLGNNIRMASDNKRSGIALFSHCKFRTFANGKIVIGNNAELSGVSITSRKKIVIGDGAMLGPNTIIVDSDFHKFWPPEERALGAGFEEDREVIIGKQVYVGMNSIILKGVNIGNHSIVAAGSVVSGVFPADVVIAGNPARVVGKRP
ncbi:MAG: acyltransferase [Deltaproteobacteria bacterium]|nr:acyltransferase [Deltaproteobacteria bacterium]